MGVDQDAIRREITEALGSVGRFRIIAELAKDPNESFTKYTILKGTGLKRVDVKSNLERLVSIGWVKEYKSIYPKYQINPENKRVQLFVDFLRKSEFL